jgi:hypothetical protein
MSDDSPQPPAEKASARRSVLRAALWAVAVASVGISVLALFHKLSRNIQNRQLELPVPVQVQLASFPSWMPDRLAAHIAYRMTPPNTPFGDPKVVDEVYQAAAQCPWIRAVELVSKQPPAGRPYGVVQVQAQFRRPLLKIMHNGEECFIDSDGVRLDALGVPRLIGQVAPSPQRPDGTVCFIYASDAGAVPVSPIHYIQLEGAAAPAPEVGQPWPGEDVADAIRLAQLVYRRTYFRQVTSIDVRNHNLRVNPHEAPLRLWARAGDRATEIRIDRFPRPEGDYVVTPQQALLKLDDYFVRHGTIAGVNQYIDTRYTQLHVSLN